MSRRNSHYLRTNSGGEGGIRTPDRVSPMPVFKTGAINRSATSPFITVLLRFLPKSPIPLIQKTVFKAAPVSIAHTTIHSE